MHVRKPHFLRLRSKPVEFQYGLHSVTHRLSPCFLSHYLLLNYLFTMLPRHARRIVLSSSTPAHIRTALTASRSSFKPSLKYRPQVASVIQSSSFHSSSRRQNGLPKSPFQTFVEVLREELRKNRELQDNVKQLQGDVDKLQDSEAMKKARQAYERARVCPSSHDHARRLRD